MKFIVIDWFYGMCYHPKLIEMFRKANPSLTNDGLQAVKSVLPDLSKEEMSDTASPSSRIIKTRLDNVSTYFDLGSDYLDRPHELSVACFSEEVLSRYEVQIDRSQVHCPDWRLRDVYLNNADQVHVCICDLADLPDEELRHWYTHNVEPDLSPDRGQMPPPFHGMSNEFVRSCLFNMTA